MSLPAVPIASFRSICRSARHVAQVGALLWSFGPLLWSSGVEAQPAVALVYFESGQHRLSPAMLEQIKRVARLAAASAADRVVCIGHTDATGTLEMNNVLAIRRVAAVKDALVREGVAETSILLIGKGASTPATGRSPRSDPLNRRVEITFRAAPEPAVEDE